MNIKIVEVIISSYYDSKSEKEIVSINSMNGELIIDNKFNVFRSEEVTKLLYQK